MGSGLGIRLSWGLVGGAMSRKGGDAKNMIFRGPRHAAHVHYFKDIRQGALQSDYVMLFSRHAGWGLGMR